MSEKNEQLKEYMGEYPLSERAKKEEEILAFWRTREVFEKTLAKPSPKGEFVFYEGPPTANGRPGIHHIEARSFKDIIPRFRTMQGYHVRRKGGWDTHGLPVELEVEKKLGLTNKKDIETYGVAKFNEECKKSVWNYVNEWHAFTERIGYWVDLENAYVTYRPEYMESVWYLLAQTEERGLLYKDYKVLPWCPRCGTALSSHELAQGYAEVDDVSVYVSFKLKTHNPKFKTNTSEEVYMLAWTTTPWTLPGNVALAVGKDIEYVLIKDVHIEPSLKQGEPLGLDVAGHEGELKTSYYIIAKEIFDKKVDQWTKEKVFTLAKLHTDENGNPIILTGADLVGLSYEPLFPYLKELLPENDREKLENAYKVYSADFVTVLDGTGIVHTAVMYGQDDFELGTSVHLPKFHLVNQQGKFIEGTGELAGLPVKEKDAFSEGEKAVLRALGDKILKKEKITHTYPFCWRCKSHILYYAHTSWYIAMSKLRDEMLKENEQINWEPEHIKEGRFGEWLSNIKDWAISRERYWGTPLPVWESEDGKKRLVVDSLQTLKKHTKTNNNTFFVMRHGEAKSNVEGFVSRHSSDNNTITEKGEREARASAEALRDKGIDLIIASPIMRTKQTAEIVRETLGLPEEVLILDERFAEINTGIFDGKSNAEYHAHFENLAEKFTKTPPEGENLSDLKRRVGEALYDIDSRESGKNILLVSHEYPLWLLFAVSEGADTARAVAMKEPHPDFITTGEYRALPFVPLPHNTEYELDLHRPYIDDIILTDNSGEELTRVKEVIDVWFDSGAMPFAQDHYPFENRERIEGGGYPADYISEAIDQTRGWFYTLHAIGVLSGRGRAYNNVICLGHILDEAGKKMSKSLGNIVNPWEMIARYGVDALRFWMYAVNQPGDSKNFDERTVDEVGKKVFNPLLNSLSLYSLYKDEVPHTDIDPRESPHILDRFILARLDECVEKSEAYLERYLVLEPAREIRSFITDFSQWFVRRSRDRIKGEDVEDKAYALATMRVVLETLSRTLAPFTPFLAEEIYQAVKKEGSEESVHLTEYPKAHTEGSGVLRAMEATREISSRALARRAESGIKVRQPLARLSYTHPDLLASAEEYHALIRDEVNVKEVVGDPSLAGEGEIAVLLDTTLTEELLEEGVLRDILRAVQDARKDAGLSPQDDARLTVSTDNAGKAFIEKYRETLLKSARIHELSFEELSEESFTAGDMPFSFVAEKV